LTINRQFQKPEHYIGPGEYFSSADDIVISTLLGSCIAVALQDSSVPLGGMNHFMLPSPKGKEAPSVSLSAKYGVNAMELLINDILKKGGTKKRLRAKVFGGSAVLNLNKTATYDIPAMNIEFIIDFLATEKIPVDSFSVGGILPRKVYFFPHTARVLMKYTHNPSSALSRREDSYAHKLVEETENAGKPILF
jgi:chemotaxis protein CheD